MNGRSGRRTTPAWTNAIVLIIVAAGSCLGTHNANAQQGGNQLKLLARNAYPTGDLNSSVVVVERFAPAQVRLGTEFEYVLKLSNLTNKPVENVTYAEEIPGDFALARAEPQPQRTADNRLLWNVGKFNPRESRTIRIFGTAKRLGELPSCGTLTFATSTCSSLTVTQPEIVLTKEMPAQVTVCDPIPVRLIVENVGTGMAENVRVVDSLPEGWTTVEGDRQVELIAGNLAAGQAREFTISARSSRPGSFTNRATATEASGLSAEVAATTRVIQPALALTKSGPAFRYIGRPARFDLNVRNDGDAPAVNTVLVDRVPQGFTNVVADNGGTVSSNVVQWNLGTIQPGEQKSVSVNMTPTTRGTFENHAQVRAYCTEDNAVATMTARGIPAILLEVIDVEDPIETGAQETYVIRVFNQGSADGTNISLVCELPPEQQFVSANGPVDGMATGNTITFKPLQTLAPKAEAVYRVIVRGIQAGDARFKVSLTSDQLDRPVEETESTHIYQ